MINKVISHFKILGKLGEGGVYKAEDTKLERMPVFEKGVYHEKFNRFFPLYDNVVVWLFQTS
ncbi:hypothetical protein BVY00_01645 [bacterium G20]|nr:hypothetical protein BVY00_01645 [bacterium G20]